MKCQILMSNKLSKAQSFWDLKDEDKDLTMFTITNLTLTKERNSNMVYMAIELKRKVATELTTASRPTKVYGWKLTHHGWISYHYLENQPLVGKPTTLWLEILPPSQPHRYHYSALYILFDKGKVEENSTP